MEEIHCVLCRTDVGGAGSRIKQLVDDHTKLRQGVKRLEMEVKVIINLIYIITGSSYH
jgi:hypothetical protein